MADAVLPHLVSRHLPGVDVLFLDTGYHFAETRGTRDAVDLALPVRVVDVLPLRTVAEQDAELGPACTSATPGPAAGCARSNPSPPPWPVTRPG